MGVVVSDLARILQKNRADRLYACGYVWVGAGRQRQNHLKELQVQILRSRQTGRRLREELIMRSEAKDHLETKLPLSWGCQRSFLLRPLTYWMRPM